MMPTDSLEQISRIAQEGYLFGYPLALMEATRRSQESAPSGSVLGSGPPNQFSHARAFPPGDFRLVIRPNFDTLYSTLWFDVSQGPLIIEVPEAGDRYYMLPFLDMWTEVFAVVGTRTTGREAGVYALATPDWHGEVPPMATRIDAPTPMGWIIGRTQTNGVADYPAVHAFQDRLIASPVREAVPAPQPSDALDEALTDAGDPLDAVSRLSGVDMLSLLSSLMDLHPAHVVDQPMVARLRRIGVDAGVPFTAARDDPRVRGAVNSAAHVAAERMTAMQSRLAPIRQGWMAMTSAIGAYGTDYLRRAVVAKVGLGANLAEDAVYPLLYRDADGAIPDGDDDYVLHFDADQRPPADAFWSVTMYGADGYTVPNDLDRYALGDRDPLVYNADGSLDLLLQHGEPDAGPRSNWLPSPHGPLGLTLRLYDPRPVVLDGTWVAPPLRRVHT